MTQFSLLAFSLGLFLLRPNCSFLYYSLFHSSFKHVHTHNRERNKKELWVYFFFKRSTTLALSYICTWNKHEEISLYFPALWLMSLRIGSCFAINRVKWSISSRIIKFEFLWNYFLAHNLQDSPLEKLFCPFNVWIVSNIKKNN